MRRRLPPTALLAAFEAAGRHQSFTAAAAELALTPSAVSRQVSTLQDMLGVPLFRRTRHGIALTDGKPLMGSEDFADMLRVVPGAYAWVGHAGTVPVHNPAYVLDDGILPVGASLLARLVETRAAA